MRPVPQLTDREAETTGLLYNARSPAPRDFAAFGDKVESVSYPGGVTSDPPAFAIRVLGTGDRAVRVVVIGEIDLSTSPELESALSRALADADDVVLDLSRVGFIDSTGLSAILEGVRMSETNGARLAISSSLSRQARKLFQLAGMLGALPLVEE